LDPKSPNFLEAGKFLYIPEQTEHPKHPQINGNQSNKIRKKSYLSAEILD